MSPGRGANLFECLRLDTHPSSSLAPLFGSTKPVPSAALSSALTHRLPFLGASTGRSDGGLSFAKTSSDLLGGFSEWRGGLPPHEGRREAAAVDDERLSTRL